jgi:hypothetical protein
MMFDPRPAERTGRINSLASSSTESDAWLEEGPYGDLLCSLAVREEHELISQAVGAI